MRKMKGKRLLSLLLTLCMVLSLAPVAAMANSATASCEWDENKEVLNITSYSVSIEELYERMFELFGQKPGQATVFGGEGDYRIAKTKPEYTWLGHGGGLKSGDAGNLSLEEGEYYAACWVYNDWKDNGYKLVKSFEVEFVAESQGERTVTVEDNPVVTFNKYYNVSDKVAEIEDQIKNFVSTEDYEADEVEVSVYGAYENYGGFYALDFLWGAWGDVVFNDATEKVKVSIPASARYPATEVEFEISVKDSRSYADIEVDTPAEVTLGTGDNEQAIKDAVLAVTTVNTNGVTVTADNLTVEPFEIPAKGTSTTVTVTVTVPNSEYSWETTKTVDVTVKSEHDPASIAVIETDNGTVTVGDVEENESATVPGGEYTITARPDRGYYVADVRVNGESVTNISYNEDKNVYVASTVLTAEHGTAYTVVVDFVSQKATEIRLNPDADVVVTYDQFEDEEVKYQLLDGVYEADAEEPITNAEVTMTSVEDKNVGEHTVTLKYAGDMTHKAAEPVKADITIKKAKAAVNVDNVTVRYGRDYDLAISAKSQNGKDVKMISFVAGLDMAEMQIVNGKVTFPETVVNVAVPPMEIFGYEIALPSGTVSLTKAIEIIEQFIPASEYVTEDQIDQMIAYLEDLQTKFGEVTVTFNGDMPENIGVYLVGAVTADANYETAMDVGTLVITPDGHRAELDWNIHDANGAIALTAIDTYDLGAHVAKLYEVPSGMTEAEAIAEAESEMELLFVGLNLDGEIVLTQDLKTEDKLTGAYAEVATIVNWGNEMYYSEPIVRTLVVVPELVDVKFVDANENNARLFTYTGDPCEMDVLVKGELTEPGNHLTVTYTGVQADGTVYNSQEAPVEAGAYTATALYSEKRNGEVVKAGIAIGAMVIEKQDSTFDLTDKLTTYNGDEQFVTVAGDANTEVLYVITGTNTVNVIIPEAVKALMPELAQTGSVDLAEVKAELGKVMAAAETMQLPEGFASELAKAKEALDKVPAVKAEINGEKPVTVGTYDVHAVTYSRTMKSVYDKATLTIEQCPVTVVVTGTQVRVGETVKVEVAGLEGVVEKDHPVEATLDYTCDSTTEGTYPIYATVNNPNYYVAAVSPANITVSKVPVTGVALNKTSETIDMKYSSTTTLTATVSPADATNKAVTWASSDPSVATVDANGVVTAVSKGTATITVTTVDGGYTDTCDVTVIRSRSNSSSSTSSSDKKPAETEKQEELKEETTLGTYTDPKDVPEDAALILTINDVKVDAFGDVIHNDVAPIIRDDRTMLPIRIIAENLGATVTWNDAEQKVTIVKDEITIEIYIGHAFALVNGEPVQLDAPAFISNSRTYLPIRFVAENLGATVLWEAETQKVYIIPVEEN